jgi:hypothetical protein
MRKPGQSLIAVHSLLDAASKFVCICSLVSCLHVRKICSHPPQDLVHREQPGAKQRHWQGQYLLGKKWKALLEENAPGTDDTDLFCSTCLISQIDGTVAMDLGLLAACYSRFCSTLDASLLLSFFYLDGIM